MMLAFLSLVLLMTLGQAMIFQQRFAVQVDDSEHARNLASGAIYQAIGQLCANDGFGGDCSFSLTSDRPTNAGLLTFNPGQAARWGIPVSINNIERSAARPGSLGRSVPAGTAQLISLGRFGGASARLECIYYRPPYPRGVIATGPIELEGSQVAGLAPNAIFPGNWNDVPTRDQAPTHVHSNSDDPRSLVLGPACTVTGNAASHGGVEIDPLANVAGEVQPYAKTQEVPAFPIQDMIARVSSVAGLRTFFPNQPVDDFVTVNSALTVDNDLELDGGVLAVRGDLHVRGKVHGRGVLLVDGHTTIDSGSHFEADRNVAVLSTGNISLSGQDRSYYFQGLLYTEAELRASQLTVLGSVVSNSPGGQARVVLDNVQVIASPVAVQSRQGLPDIRLVADDSYRFFFSVTPDPNRPGQYLYYGKTIMCESFEYGREVPHTQVVFKPGVEEWSNGDTFPYDGTRTALMARMTRFLGNWGEAVGNSPDDVAAYLDRLTAQATQPEEILEINLNQVVQPVERARILYWGSF